MKFRRYLMVLALLQPLAGCMEFFHQGDPLWAAPIVSKKDCRSIDGRYFDKGKLYEGFMDNPSTPKDQRFSSLMSSNSIKTTSLTPEELKRMGAVSDKQRLIAQWQHTAAQQREFDASSETRIVRTPEGWEISLFGGDGNLYVKSFVSIQHPNVGCDSRGRVILRDFSTGGGPGTAKTGYATERIFEKTENGSIKMHRHHRNWLRTMEKPPREEKEESFVFPPSR